MEKQDTESLYDEWAAQYDQCLEDWGYKVPHITADLFKQNYAGFGEQKEIKLFDLGCGTGLVGKYIRDIENVNVVLFGSDLSAGQFPMATQKGYKELQQWDLNQFPYPYNENAFDVLTCCGTLTYAQDFNAVFTEWCRITKPGGIIICTHRSDMMQTDVKHFDQMEQSGKWKKLALTDPVPYLPNNENYGMDIQVQFYVARNEKKL
eukprot:CAMPEP_0197020712 /NCGR_PEP_ID=MMETSP1384-20130603/1579_1 /TAXON_ID=29189 /ORGANISM="Ammonia sp." /LENGTH=205 /DNA_ID=CAMNT_0042448391 /DNA_START=250 /DNA_END=867 /DNA_ORIENTATION=+